MKTAPTARLATWCLAAAVVSAPAALAAAAQDQDHRALRRTPVVEVFEQSRDAVVSIAATELVTVRGGSPFDDFFDMPRRERHMKVNSVGSGFVIHPDGYIVTNAHVVARTTETQVVFADGREYDAQLVAADPARDLAVLKIEADRLLPILPLGRSNDLMIGETVVAIGNPLGYKHTVTAGVISAIDREMAVGNDILFTGLVQTDASINPGNSGGPLLNVLGELVGVNTAIRGDAQNIGFAIPVDHLRAVLPELLDVERRYHIEAGLTVDALGEARVVGVRPSSPAERAGVHVGDVLVAIDGRPVRHGLDFDIALIDRRPGERLDLAMRRDDRTYQAALELGQRSAPDGESLALAKLGLELYPLPEEAATELGLRRGTRLMVVEVEPGGPADAAGIHPRDILLGLGRYAPRTVDELGQLLDQTDPGDIVEIAVLRLEQRRKLKRSGPIRVR